MHTEKREKIPNISLLTIYQMNEHFNLFPLLSSIITLTCCNNNSNHTIIGKYRHCSRKDSKPPTSIFFEILRNLRGAKCTSNYIVSCYIINMDRIMMMVVVMVAAAVVVLV